MITEFLPVKELREVSVRGMELQPELSLGPSSLVPPGFTKSSSSESDGGSRKKRKHFTWEEPMSHASLELQLNDPLPLDWEQCLDLRSGRMYYLNRKTLEKSWIRPKERGVNLDLNISTIPTSFDGRASSTPAAPEELKKGVSSGGNMVAVACVNCHLLVMLCKSSPSCPNCKFVHPLLPAMPQTPPRKLDTTKTLETLSLLH